MFRPTLLFAALAAAFPLAGFAAEAASPVERVAVTGSNIRTTDKEGPSPVQVISAQAIKDSGKTSLSDLLRSISANSGNSYNEQFTASFSAGSSGLSLRGIGQKNTLILVNGRRVANYATAQNLQDTFVDLNSLPLAAVQRIEVLKDGASAIYGSDAVGGVVNIILPRQYQGLEVSGSTGGSTEGTGQQEYGLALQGGFGTLDGDGYNLAFSFDAQKRDQLDQKDVDWLRDSDFRGLPGGSLAWNISNYYGTDPTRTLGGTHGPLTRLPYDAITPGKQGQVLAYNPADYKTLIPGVERYHASARGTWQLGADTQLYAEGLYGFSRADQIFGAPLNVSSSLRAWNHRTQSLDTISVQLPAGHPNNPGQTPVAVNATLFDLGTRLKRDDVRFYRALAGARGTFGSWDWDVALGRSQSRMREYAWNFVNRYVFEEALRNGTYHFADPSRNDPALLERLRISTLRPATSSLTSFDATISGELTALPAGPLGFAAGYQFRDEAMDSRTSEQVLSGTELRPALDIIDGSRQVSAVYSEFSIPLQKVLTLNVAGRYDHYSDFGGAFSPKASLRYQPTPWLLLRGTLSRGFRAPSLPEITQSTAVSYASVADPRDPISPNLSRGVTNLTVANPDLKPERSDNFNIGAVVSPDRDSSVGVDFYRIRQSNIINSESGDYILANETTAPHKVVRDEQGRVVTLYRQFRNQGTRTASGIDIDLRRRFADQDWGRLTLEAQLSRVLRFAEPEGEGEAPKNGAGSNLFGSIPKWRGVFTASWELGAFSQSLGWNYVGGYDNTYLPDESYPSKVKAFHTFDWTVNWKPTRAATVSLVAQNLTNRRPPWDPSAGFFDYTQADPRGRFVSVKASYKF